MSNFTRSCKWCSRSFTTIYETKIYCDRACKDMAKQSRQHTKQTKGIAVANFGVRHWVRTIYIKWCKNCNELINTKLPLQIYCDGKCSEMAKQTRVRQTEVARFKKNQAPNIVARIYYRDKGICGICHEPIDLRLQYPDPLSISIDHIIPVSQGGNNFQGNLQPAHLICNTRRGNKPLD